MIEDKFKEIDERIKREQAELDKEYRRMMRYGVLVAATAVIVWVSIVWSVYFLFTN